jgi:hypothetical protein
VFNLFYKKAKVELYKTYRLLAVGHSKRKVCISNGESLDKTQKYKKNSPFKKYPFYRKILKIFSFC